MSIKRGVKTDQEKVKMRLPELQILLQDTDQIQGLLSC